MKKLSSADCSQICAARLYLKALAVALHHTVAYGFDEWKRARIEKYARLDQEEAQMLLAPCDPIIEKVFIEEPLAK